MEHIKLRGQGTLTLSIFGLEVFTEKCHLCASWGGWWEFYLVLCRALISIPIFANINNQSLLKAVSEIRMPTLRHKWPISNRCVLIIVWGESVLRLQWIRHELARRIFKINLRPAIVPRVSLSRSKQLLRIIYRCIPKPTW